jgi:hypothetical protein
MSNFSAISWREQVTFHGMTTMIGHTHIELFVLFLYIFIFPAKHVKDNRYRMQYNIFFSSPEYKNPTKCVSLVQIGHCCHPMECNLFSPWYSWKIAHLTLNSNHSILWLIIFASEGLMICWKNEYVKKQNEQFNMCMPNGSVYEYMKSLTNIRCP